jgi:type II secretory pathway component PulM
MEMSLKSELKSDLKGSKNRRLPVKEKTYKQKHRENLMNKILNDYFGLLIILAVAVILIASYYLLIWPKYQKIVASINATFYEKNQLTPKYQELADYQALFAAYQKVNPDDIQKIKGLIPKDYIKEDLFTELIYLASTKGLAVNSLNIVKDTEATSTVAAASRRTVNGIAATSTPLADLKLPNGVGSFNVKITLGKVNYPTLKTWLKTVENSLRIIDVKSLSFDPKTSTASLEMVTYYLKK